MGSHCCYFLFDRFRNTKTKTPRINRKVLSEVWGLQLGSSTIDRVIQGMDRLLRRHRSGHSATVLRWVGFDLSELDEVSDHSFHHFATFFDVSHFAATEEDRDLDLIFVLKKALGLTDLGIDIVSPVLGRRRISLVLVVWCA